MRTIKELLTIILNRPKELEEGLCYTISSLNIDQEFAEYEYLIIKAYIRRNRPSKWSSWPAFKSRNSVFYWPCGDLKSRIKWLKKHIKLNS